MKKYSLLLYFFVALILHSCTAEKTLVTENKTIDTTDTTTIKKKISFVKNDSTNTGKRKLGIVSKKPTTSKVGNKKDSEVPPASNEFRKQR